MKNRISIIGAALLLVLGVGGTVGSVSPAYAAGLETTVTPVAGAVPVSLDTTSVAAIAAALHGLSVEATVTALPASGPATVSIETTVPVVWAGIAGVDRAAFDALLVVAGAVLGAGAFYLFVRGWGGRG